MKKLCLVAILFLLAGVFAYSQDTLSLDNAISASVNKIENEIGTGKKIALLNFISQSQGLSSYVIDELMDIFTNHKKLSVTERSRMDAILRERNFQTSGEVSDAEIRAIGNQLGADYIITGQLDYSGLAYRFRVYAIDIEKGTREASTTANIPSNDRQLRYFLGGEVETSEDIEQDAKKTAYTGQNKPFEFSIGLGGYGKLWFNDYEPIYWGDNTTETVYDIGLNICLNAEIFSYVLFDVSFNLLRRSGDGWYNNDSELEFSLFGKYPFHINQSLNLYPLLGIGFDMLLSAKANGYDWEPSRENLKGGDSLFLKLGGGLDYNFNDHFRFNLKLLYSIFLTSEDSKIYEKYSLHGPGLFVGIKYVF
jgi:opacity protein-like surface antigen